MSVDKDPHWSTPTHLRIWQIPVCDRNWLALFHLAQSNQLFITKRVSNDPPPDMLDTKGTWKLPESVLTICAAGFSASWLAISITGSNVGSSVSATLKALYVNEHLVAPSSKTNPSFLRTVIQRQRTPTEISPASTLQLAKVLEIAWPAVQRSPSTFSAPPCRPRAGT